jgi:hypothetical protein
MPDLIRHPGAQHHKKALDSLRGEFIEPRVKPGMTDSRKCRYVNLDTVSQRKRN